MPGIGILFKIFVKVVVISVANPLELIINGYVLLPFGTIKDNTFPVGKSTVSPITLHPINLYL